MGNITKSTLFTKSGCHNESKIILPNCQTDCLIKKLNIPYWRGILLSGWRVWNKKTLPIDGNILKGKAQTFGQCKFQSLRWMVEKYQNSEWIILHKGLRRKFFCTKMEKHNTEKRLNVYNEVDIFKADEIILVTCFYLRDL